MSVKHIPEKDFKAEVLDDKGMVLVDFYAEWCGPCKMLAPILEDVSKEIGDKLKIVKINTDEAQTLSKEFQVMSIPTVYLFDDGEPISKFVGVKTKEEIIDFVENAARV